MQRRAFCLSSLSMLAAAGVSTSALAGERLLVSTRATKALPGGKPRSLSTKEMKAWLESGPFIAEAEGGKVPALVAQASVFVVLDNGSGMMKASGSSLPIPSPEGTLNLPGLLPRFTWMRGVEDKSWTIVESIHPARPAGKGWFQPGRKLGAEGMKAVIKLTEAKKGDVIVAVAAVPSESVRGLLVSPTIVVMR